MGLEIKCIEKTFFSDKGTTHVLNHLDLEVENGEFICLLGPSGCGKTTLLNIMAGLEKPTSGEINLNGRIIKSPGPDRVVVFQEAALFPWLNVIDNVEFGMKMIGIPKKERLEKALHFINVMHLNGFEHALVHELSGGMKQRVALARSFCMESDILLMDEPFSALDIQTKKILQDELLKLWKDTQRTIVFITHSPEEAVYLADKIVLMSKIPCKVKEIIQVRMERPRNAMNPDYVNIIKRIKCILKEEAEKKNEKYSNFKKGSILHNIAWYLGNIL